MRKIVLTVAAVALLGFGAALVTPSVADAACACTSETVADDAGNQTCVTTCCNSGVDPNQPPEGPPEGVCGEICLTDALTGDATDEVQPVDQALLVAGSDASGTPAGCIALLGGLAHSNQATEQDPGSSYGDCLADAVAACVAGGCATVTIAEGACE
jgi:hypothetical protein